MLSGSTLDLDTFAEVVAFVESVDTVNDNIVTNLTAQTGASIDSLEIQVSADASDADASIDSLETALGNEITATNGDVTAISASIDSLESATGGDTTAINSSIDSLETLVAADASDADASIDSLETAVTGNDGDITNLGASVDSLETLVGADAADADASIDSLETQVSGVASDLSEYEGDANASIDSLETLVGADAADADASIDSLETALNGFAKEAYVHLAVTGLVSGSGATDAVLATDGSNGGDNVTESAGQYTFDLAIPMEAVNAIEGEAGIIDLQINGLGVDHSAVRWNNANSFTLIEAQLGYVLEASDRIEFKYIKD